MAILKKFTKNTYVVLGSAVVLLIAFIIAVVSGTTGYMAGKAVNGLIVAFSLIALIILAALPFVSSKIGKIPTDILLVAAGALIAVTTCVLIWDRVTLAADVWFIPVNYPEAEEAALNVSIVGAVFYLISFVGVCVSSFFDDPLLKDEAKETPEEA
ncbi:MAG TPA: hypothetical protein IAC60_02140 [Candidatus Enterosoma merdigallinarum]|nr:hypothetical protein [Candidatus Enterosoma merdigallinarum]